MGNSASSVTPRIFRSVGIVSCSSLKKKSALFTFYNFLLISTSRIKRFSKYGGQFFAYTQQLIPKSKEPSLAPTLYHDLELSGKKVCFRPTRPKYSLGFISQALGRNAFRRVDKTYGIQFGTKYVELYLYNESTGMADIKTDLTLPSWIVYKTLALLNDRWKNTNADLAKRLEEEIGSYKQEQSELK